MMATRGFENWTEADVAAHSARIGVGRTTEHVGLAVSIDQKESILGNPDAKQSHVKKLTGDKKRHKYRAEPCIVTPDLTLFTAADIAQIPGAEVLFAQRASLKDRAAVVGIVGEWFGSTKEGRRYIELKQLEKAGAIRNLDTQVAYVLTAGIADVPLGEWRADFVYEWLEPGGMGHSDVWTETIEDVKGLKTPLYRWKKKHVEAQYRITIRET